MAMYWCFQLRHVARRVLYLDQIRHLEGFFDVQIRIEQYRSQLTSSRRPWRDLPM
jgi:hypothetical protein